MFRLPRSVTRLILLTGLLSGSMGHAAPRPAIQAEAAVVQDIHTGKTIYARNPQETRPIASLTKLMTALVILDSRQDLKETITLTQADVDTLKHSRSRVPVGLSLSRKEALQLALVASDNRAAHALGRNYPGGVAALVRAMNAKARALGLNATFADPTGLDSRNQASAEAIAGLARAALKNAFIRSASSTPKFTLRMAGRKTEFANTNNLVRAGKLPVRLSKTGFTNEAGRCLVMVYRHRTGDRVLVLLNENSKESRTRDAVRLLGLA